MLPLPGIDPVYRSLFYLLHLCPDLFFNLSVVVGSFWLASLFLQVSSLITKIKDLRGNQGLPVPALLAKKFSYCVSYCLVEVGASSISLLHSSASSNLPSGVIDIMVIYYNESLKSFIASFHHLSQQYGFFTSTSSSFL